MRIQARDQDLKGTLTFDVVGDLAAPSYFRVDQQGNVFVRNSLKDDIATEYVVCNLDRHDRLPGIHEHYITFHAAKIGKFTVGMFDYHIS